MPAKPRPYPAVECGDCGRDVPNDNRPDGTYYHAVGCRERPWFVPPLGANGQETPNGMDDNSNE